MMTNINSVGNFESGKKEVIFSGHRRGIGGVVGHTGHILALAVSSDGKFLVSGWVEGRGIVNVVRHIGSVHWL